MKQKIRTTILIIALAISTLILSGCQKKTTETEAKDPEPIVEEVIEEEVVFSSETEMENEKTDGANAGLGNIEVPDDIVEGTVNFC